MNCKQEKEEFIPDTEVVYMRRIGQYGAENYALMAKMKSWAAERGLLTEEAAIYGIALDNQVTRRVITSGKYVVFMIEHTTKAVADFWTSFSTKMAKLGYKMDFSRPIMERYSVVMVKNGYCEMCVPILC